MNINHIMPEDFLCNCRQRQKIISMVPELQEGDCGLVSGYAVFEELFISAADSP
jgi:hypothetical protein